MMINDDHDDVDDVDDDDNDYDDLSVLRFAFVLDISKQSP